MGKGVNMMTPLTEDFFSNAKKIMFDASAAKLQRVIFEVCGTGAGIRGHDIHIIPTFGDGNRAIQACCICVNGLPHDGVLLVLGFETTSPRVYADNVKLNRVRKLGKRHERVVLDFLTQTQPLGLELSYVDVKHYEPPYEIAHFESSSSVDVSMTAELETDDKIEVTTVPTPSSSCLGEGPLPDESSGGSSSNG